MKNEITLDQARKVLEVVDAGLSEGMGNPVPGKMCVEAAVCYALGQPHGDEPKCVRNSVRRFKIRLNDSPWSSKDARAAGMRKLAIAQLGTNDPRFDEKVFVEVLVDQTIRKIVPHALRCAIRAAGGAHKASLEDAAVRCELDGDLAAAKNAQRAADAASAAYASAAAYAAYAATSPRYVARNDIALNMSADIGVEALRAAGAHGIALMDQLIPA